MGTIGRGGGRASIDAASAPTTPRPAPRAAVCFCLCPVFRFLYPLEQVAVILNRAVFFLPVIETMRRGAGEDRGPTKKKRRQRSLSPSRHCTLTESERHGQPHDWVDWRGRLDPVFRGTGVPSIFCVRSPHSPPAFRAHARLPPSLRPPLPTSRTCRLLLPPSTAPPAPSRA